jgi:hypothetical protein
VLSLIEIQASVKHKSGPRVEFIVLKSFVSMLSASEIGTNCENNSPFGTLGW